MTDQPTITSVRGGPLLVKGMPLVRKTAVHSEHGEPLTWVTSEAISERSNYALCRCGSSSNKPFCDGSHNKSDFEGVDTADTSDYADRAKDLGGTGISVSDDRSICAHAGFCGTRLTNIWNQVSETAESTVRLAVINQIEKCPSGAITYRLDDSGGTNEPDYPSQVAATNDGPLWVTGEVAVTTSEGTELEKRSRMTLCRCGQSSNKPLCDGSHWEAEFKDG